MHALQMSGISKRFPGVTALDSVDLDVARGEVVALVGENGAGKSTLMKILAGIHQPDSGTIRINGESVVHSITAGVGTAGIGIIHQELEVIDSLDIAANVFLGREPTRGPSPVHRPQRTSTRTPSPFLTRLESAAFASNSGPRAVHCASTDGRDCPGYLVECTHPDHG